MLKFCKKVQLFETFFFSTFWELNNSWLDFFLCFCNFKTKFYLMTEFNGNSSESINAKEWASASKILNRAALLIEEKGWQQGSIEPVPRECLTTALEHSFREKEYSIVDFNYAREIGRASCRERVEVSEAAGG